MKILVLWKSPNSYLFQPAWQMTELSKQVNVFAYSLTRGEIKCNLMK